MLSQLDLVWGRRNNMTDDEFEAALIKKPSRKKSVEDEAFDKALDIASETGVAARAEQAKISNQPGYEKLAKSFAGAGTKAALGIKEKLLGLSAEEEAQRAGIEEYIKQAGWPGIIGAGGAEAALMAPAAAFGAPAAVGVLGRSAISAGLASLYAPTGEQGQAAAQAAVGQAGGEFLGKGLPYAAEALSKGYQGLKNMLHAPTGAAQQLGRFAEASGQTLPENVELSRTYENIPGLKPTLGMMVPESQRSLIDLENIVRAGHGKSALAEADIYNNQVIRKGIQERAFDPERVTQEMRALNEETGALREKAFETARMKPSEELAGPILRETQGIRSRPGEMGMGSPEAQTIASDIEKRALGPVTRKSVIGAQGLAVEVPEFARAVDPANLYAARKRIDDILRGASGSNDELANAVKANKSTAMQLKSSIDEALSNASEGKWDNYLDTYKEKIKPIEEGIAFQNVLGRFEKAPRIPGTDIASISPYALRNAAKDTYKEIGANTLSRISEEGRAFLTDAERAMGSIENTQKGLRAISGSQTTPMAAALVRNAAKIAPKLVSDIVQSVGLATESRAEKLIVDAIKNPEHFQALLDRYNKLGKTKISPAQAQGLQVLLGTIGATTSTRF